MRANYGMRVTNMGVGSATSSHVVDFIVNKHIDIADNNFITILLGTNDCDGSVSQAVYKENIIFMIDTIHLANPEAYIVLITPPIIRFNEYDTSSYTNAIYDIKNQMTSPYIYIADLHSGEYPILHQDLARDGIHLNHAGDDKLYKNIRNVIDRFECPISIPISYY